ncbi:MAG: hypothetical protein ACJ73N_06190 [Bryobacteraceae bacterium]
MRVLRHLLGFAAGQRAMDEGIDGRCRANFKEAFSPHNLKDAAEY